MAKTAAPTTISPSKMTLGAPVLAEDAIAVAEQANDVFANRPQMHVSLACGPGGWATNSIGTLSIYFRIFGEGFCQLLRFRIRIRPETETMLVGSRCWFDSGESGTVRFEIGASSVDIAHADTDNGTELNDSIDVSALSGWQTVKVWLRRDVGSLARSAYLYSIRVQDAPQASLPDPEDS